MSVLSKQVTPTYAVFICLIVFLMSCKKGEEGPQGPTGTANVNYSDWFAPNPYALNTVFGIKHFTYEKTAPDITQQVLDSGMVLVFGKLLGYNQAIWPATQVAQMPILLTYIQGGSTMTDTWSALATPQKLTIRFVNDKNEYNLISTQHQFRYVIIPGGNKISARRGTDYRHMNYSEICRLFQIPE